LATFKSSPNSKTGWLLNIYSVDGDEVFSVKIGRKINLNYQGSILRSSHFGRKVFRTNF
jgi:hypothetical protein